MPRPAAIFDVDGTLLAGTSGERLFVRRALRDGLLSPLRLLDGGARAVWAWASGRVATPLALKAYLRDLPCAPLETLGVACVHGEVVPRLRPELLDAMRAQRARGACIVLLTGTLDFLGTAIAQSVGADVVAAARLERRDGRFTGRVLAPYPHGEGKVAALVELAQRLDLDLAASAAWANHGSDVAHLERVGLAHAVAPDARLRRVALQRGWSVYDDPTDTPRPRPQR